MKSLSKRAISLILAILMIMDVFTPVAVVASTNSPQNNVHVLDEVPDSETNSQNNDILIPATPQTNPEEDTLLPAEVPGQNSSQNSSQKPAQKPAQKPVQNNKTPNQLYKSWTLVNPGKTTYTKGDILDLSKLSVRVTKTDGSVATLSYVQLLKDTNFDVIENVGNKINLQPGKGSVTLVGPSLNPITVNIVVNDSADGIQGANPNDELVPAIDPQAKEENDELVVAENPNDKKTNIIEGNEQNSPEKDKQTEEKLEEEALKGSILDQVAGKEAEENQLGFEKFDPLKALGLNREADRELTEEELEAGLTKVELPTLSEAPVSPVFFRSGYQSTGLIEDANIKEDLGLDMSDEIVPEAVGAGNNEDPQNVLQLEDKKFNIRTNFQTKVANGPIHAGQYFDIKLDDKLTLKDQFSLQPLKYNGEVIATAKYNAADNTITYKLVKDINEDISVPVNIPVDYNTQNITPDENGNFVVTNKVSGLGVINPKDFNPKKVNKFGNVTNQITEPGRKEVTEIIDSTDKEHKVYLEEWATPVIENKNLVGFNWTFTVKSDTNLNSLGYRANFTTVKGSGLGEIKDIKINGQDAELADQLENALGIVDSKHHALEAPAEGITYTFFTEVTDKQSAYMVDFSLALTAQNKVGAKRCIADEGYNLDDIAVATTSRVGMNNRTTILGEFPIIDGAKWTVTDAVSTGDNNEILPLEQRTLGGDQSQTGTQIAVYKLNSDGQMVEDKAAEETIRATEAQETFQVADQPVGTIAAYVYDTAINKDENQPEAKKELILGGVEIAINAEPLADDSWHMEESLDISEEEVPQAVGAGQLNLGGKKFNIRTIFQTSTINGPIRIGQFFNIHLDEKLTVKDPSSLKSIYRNGVEIAKPEYDKNNNIIKYKIITPISENLNIKLNIPVDYNPEKITLDPDGTFTVINKVSGLGVTNPKALLPEKIDKNGNPAGTIIEPGRHDVIQIFDDEHDKSYAVNIDTKGSPVVEDGEMKSINWTVRVHSTTDLNGLGFKLNLTAVEGSGLEKIDKVKLNGNDVTLTPQLQGATGIVDSKHHSITESANDLVYTFNTPIKTVQSAYMLDVSGILTKRNNLLGATRLILDEAYKSDIISEATPTRVGMNNRTTIEGKFKTKDTATWTVTDGVLTGDDKDPNKNNGLPWETRTLGGKQTIASGKSVVYGIDTDPNNTTYGQMVVKRVENTITAVPPKETDPQGTQAVGNIAVYEFNTNLTDATANEKIAKDYSLGGVSISKYKDIVIEQIWNLPDGGNMPTQNIEVIDKADKSSLASKQVKEEVGKNRLITIPDVKYWDFNEENGKNVYIAKKLGIKQNLPKDLVTIGGKQYRYNENSNYYKEDTKTYQIRNSAIESTAKTPGSFTVVKVDSKDPTKKLSGAVFYLLGNNGVEVETDANGKAEFKNIAPGTYTLTENKAPEGYKLDQSTKIINISDNGEINVSGDNIEFLSAAAKTEKVNHNKYPNWPDYMNTMHYGKITKNGTTNQVEFYIYLKPDSDNGAGGTNRDTRFNISIPGVNITDVTAYDVSPNDRNKIRTAMEKQIIDTEQIKLDVANNVINVNQKERTIRGATNITDSYTGKTGYQIFFPASRFKGDWGFLVKVKADIGNRDATTITYDWLTTVNTANETNLTKTINLVKTASDGEDSTNKIIVTNEAFEKSPIKITKFADQFDKDGNRIKLEDAEFALKDSEGNLISNKFANKDGEVDFGTFPPGTYKLEEVKAPDGYKKSDVYFEVVVNEKGEVTYNAKFEDGIGTPKPGQDFIIEKGEDTDTANKEIITNVSQRLEYQENEPGDIGQKTGTWEAYRYESLKYHADITLSETKPGTRFNIQFDPNLDFTQYFSSFPKINVDGVDVADPYFDYNTNLLTYVYNEKSKGGAGTASINLRGIIPSKFFAKESGSYPFTIKVGPKGTKTLGNPVIDKQMINADYERYDTGTGQPSQAYYFRDVYKKEDGNWYVTVMSYFNPLGDRSVGVKTLSYNWLTTTFQDQNIARWTGKGFDPLYKLNDIKIYRTEYERHYVGDVPLNKYMPLSFGIRPEQDPYIYNLVYHQPINPNQAIDRRFNDFRLDYDPNRYDKNGLISNKAKAPLKITTPAIRQGEGYVIEQTFQITNIEQFNKTWRAFYMSNGNLESAFASKANVNTAIGDQTGGEIPKFYKEIVGLINKKYVPGKFRLIKYNEVDPNTKLANATFSLTDEDKNTIYRSSNANGEVDFTNIAPGRYTLEEYKAPDNYQLTNKKWQVTVLMDGTVRILETSITGGGQSYIEDNDHLIEIPVANKPVGKKFRVYKKDGDGQPLQGAKFRITKPDGTEQFKEVESNDKGIVEFPDLLPENQTYILEETKAPDGYLEPAVKKWVLKVEDGKVKVYNYSQSDSKTGQKSILGVAGTEWVDAKNRNTFGWSQYDNRWKGWAGNSDNAEYLGTRIIAKNTKDKYIIQRYIINPEGRNIKASTATIYRQLPQYPNMDWFDENKFDKDKDIKVFTLDKKVTGLVSDLRLNDYNAQDISDSVKSSMKEVDGKFGEPARLGLSLPQTTNPIVIDIKVPYKEESGGVGTGMDWTENDIIYWKADYYEKASEIKTTGPIEEKDGNIVGSYIAEGSIDVTNELKTTSFKLKKVKEGTTPSPIQGATFKLTGPGISAEGIVITTGSDGTISFDNLKPGEYTLEETAPAPGYEQANNPWTVTITKDGKTYIKENKEARSVSNTTVTVAEGNAGTQVGSVEELKAMLYTNLTSSRLKRSLVETVLGQDDLEIGGNIISSPLRAGDGWEPVDLNKSQGQYYTRGNDGTWATTRITEVNKSQGKFRQIFEVKEGISSPVFYFHTEPYEGTINGGTRDTKNTFDFKVNSVKVGGVNKSWKDAKFFDYNNGGKTLTGYQIKLDGYQDGKTVIEVEYSYPQTGEAGMGMEFRPYSSSPIKYASQRFTDAKYVNIDVKKEYKITGYSSTEGSVTASPTTSEAGKLVTLNVSSQTGFRLKENSLKVTDANGGNVTINNNTFTMPASDVTISAKFEKIPETTYKVIVNYQENGTVTANPSQNVKEGDPVTLTLNPNEGYKLKELTVNSTSGPVAYTKVDDTTYTFKMPASNVGINVSYEKPQPASHNINITSDTNKGSVSASPASAKKGDQVTLTVKPNPGFEIASVSMNGQSLTATNGVYTFTMPDSDASVVATFKQRDLGTEIPKDKFAQITNKQVGLDLKIHKKNRYDSNLANAIFNIWKANDKYEKQGGILATGISNENGIVEFKDKQGNKVNLPEGKYVLEEAFAPLGYKKPTSPWKVDVVEENGTLVAKYNGPEETPSSYLASEKAVDANLKENGDTLVTKTVGGIKYASRLTRINTEGKTYVQRIYIDTRNYKSSDPNNKENIVNVQIKPKYKREEIDTAGQPPVTIKDGVKTAYRSTYEIINAKENPDQAVITDILQNYDISKPDVRSVNTARWRPFDWGFDEDQLNLKPGVYFIDVEGFYDDVIITGESDKKDKYTIPTDDQGKIDLNVDFFDGPRQFEQLVFDKDTSSFTSKSFDGASYQGGIETVRQRYEDKLYAKYISQGYTPEVSRKYAKKYADQWANTKETDQKYVRALSKKATLTETEYTGGYITPSIDGKPASHIPTRIDISSLYKSSKTNTVPQEGMTIVNDDETYNITFSKHGKDKDDATVEEITKRRLEGGVFKLQRKVREDFYEDVEGSTVISAFNGYFGFRGLKPGRYRLMEIQAPKGYKPIEGPLLYFTVETVSLISDQIADPRTGQYIKMSDVDYYFPTSTDPYTLGTTPHKFDTLKMKDPTDNTKEILLKNARNVDLETSKIINPDNNQEVLFRDVSIKFPVLMDKEGKPLKDSEGKDLKNTYRISELQITPKSNGYISLEYDKANGVYQYVPEKSTTEDKGLLVDFVTSATAKNMGKIINTKPGQGEVTINKVDEKGVNIKAQKDAQGNLKPGAKFRLTNTLTEDKPEEKTVGEDGTLKFSGLKIGTYKLEEISSPDGHINTDQQWHFTVGGKDLDPYAEDNSQKRNNLSDKITLKTNKVLILNPKDSTNRELKGNSEIHPHIGESLEFENTFKIDPSVKINPGDYFVVNLTKNIDLNGVFEDEADNLDIFADGVGTIAKAKYDKEKGTITYIFTEYAKLYDLVTFSNKITAFINLYANKKSADKISVGMNIGEKTDNNKDIKLVYDLGMVSYHDYEGNNLNMTSKIVKYNPKTGEFVHYYYINRLRTSLKESEFQFSSDQYIDDLVVKKLKLRDNSKIEKDMPESFGIDETSANLRNDGNLISISRLTPGYYDFGVLDDIGPKDSYILKVTGKVANKDKSKYTGYGKLAHYHGNELIIEGHRYDQVYAFTNEATAKAELTIQAVNPANKIKFKKINDRNEALENATFIIQYKNDKETWNAYGQPAKSDKDGLFEFTKLPKGEYRLLETQAPKGYDTPKDPLVEFKVDDKGVIYRKIPVRNEKGEIVKENGVIKTIEVEEPGIVPIDIVNTSTKEIEFVKVDAANTSNVLTGAEFEVWFKKSKDGDYSKDILKLYEKKDTDGKVTERQVLLADETKPEGFEEVTKFVTGKDGKIKFKFKEPGYYALKEIKAPKGYIPPRDFMKEFVLIDGKILEDNYHTEMSVDKSVGGVWTNGWYDTYDTSISLTFNPNGEEITYTKDKSKLTLSGLPYNTEHWDNFYPQTGISINVYTVEENGKTNYLKDIQLDKSRDYNTSTSRGQTTIDLYSLLKPDGQTNDDPFKSNKKLIFRMSSKLALNTTLDIKSKIEIGDGADKINEERTYAIGTKGNEKISESYKFSSLGELKSPFNIENKKAEYPSTGGMGTFIFTSIGASLIGLAYLSYRRRRGLVFDE